MLGGATGFWNFHLCALAAACRRAPLIHRSVSAKASAGEMFDSAEVAGVIPCNCQRFQQCRGERFTGATETG